MKYTKKFITYFSTIFLLSCSVSTNQPLETTDNTMAQSVKEQNSDKENYLKQIETMLEKYPEAQKNFVDWKPENQSAFELKQNLTQKLLKSKNLKISRAELEKASIETANFKPEAYRPVDFKKDQGNHMNKLTEWWYYNGQLTGTNGRKFGYEFCIFRATPLVYFAHVAVTDITNQKFYYIRDYFSPLKVKLKKETADVSFDNKQVIQQLGDFKYNIKGDVGNVKFNLTMDMEKGPLMINGNGLIDMPEGIDSYYYSLTKLKTSGTITENGAPVNVSGQSWMDHQWGNFFVLRTGWDWFSFQMEDGTEYNLFSFRNKQDVTLKQFVNVLDQNNRGASSMGFEVKRLDWWTSPNTGDLYVTKWEVNLPERKEKFIVEANNKDQEVHKTKPYDVAPSYWEGSCKITKILEDGTQVNGLGYIEHFSYKQKIN